METHQMHKGLDCSLFTSNCRVAALHLGRPSVPLAYFESTRAAFPDEMAGRHLRCFRTLRGISVRCTLRGHCQHSLALQPVS